MTVFWDIPLETNKPGQREYKIWVSVNSTGKISNS